MGAAWAGLTAGDHVRELGIRWQGGTVVDPDPSWRGPWYVGRVEVSWGVGWRNFPLALRLVRSAR